MAIKPTTFAVTFRSGGDYIPENVIALATQVRKNLTVPHEFVCYTDTPIDHELVIERPLANDFPGSWAILEMFKNEGPTIVTGLDTIVPGNINKLGELALTCPAEVIYMCRPRNRRMLRRKFWASGIMIWNGDWRWVFDEFDYKKESQKWRWEQEYTSNAFKKRGIEVRTIQDYITGWYSYKVLMENELHKKRPEDASIITFCGRPRPHLCGQKWVMDIYNTYKDWKFTIPFEGIHDEIYGSDENIAEGDIEDLLDNEPET